MKWQGYQALTRRLRGEPRGPSPRSSKLLWSSTTKTVTEAAMEMVGPAGMIGFGEGT